MINQIKYATYSLILIVGLMSCKSGSNEAGGNVDVLDEQQRPLADFKVYRGNNHAHTILTWTHGAHRVKSITNLDAPTKFHESWNVPPGMDYRDHNTISHYPEDYTNRQGLPANHFKLAMEHGYDFYSITDHSQEPNMQPVSVDNPSWQSIQKAAEEYDDIPNFVALAGFEFSRNTTDDGGGGHINVINSYDYINADHGQRGPVAPWPEANWSIPKFYDWVKSAKAHGDKGNVVVSFNHPNPVQYDDWEHIDDEIVELISTFELHTKYQKMRWESYIRALNKGWKVSPIGVHDNHGYDAIINAKRYPPTIVLAPELTKEAITKALRQRRTFASWIEGVELRYAVNGFIMGSTLDSPESFNFQIELKTRPSEPGERVRRIQVLHNHFGGEDEMEVAAELVLDGDKDEVVWSPIIENPDAKYFLLRVYHNSDMKDDGTFKTPGSTVSAPVWTGR